VQNEQGANTVDQFAEKIMQQYPDLTARPIRKVSASEGQILEKIKNSSSDNIFFTSLFQLSSKLEKIY